MPGLVLLVGHPLWTCPQKACPPTREAFWNMVYGETIAFEHTCGPTKIHPHHLGTPEPAPVPSPETDPVAPHSSLCALSAVCLLLSHSMCALWLCLGYRDRQGWGILKAAMSPIIAEPLAPSGSLPVALLTLGYEGRSGIWTRAQALTTP
mmetsp:Transcript_82542/g.145612  ORF Transcript_82542/g.145612 Transcript_82542/m.145612 type:complete len:150 (-) Transcript_82542:144-593(-)